MVLLGRLEGSLQDFDVTHGRVKRTVRVVRVHPPLSIHMNNLEANGAGNVVAVVIADHAKVMASSVVERDMRPSRVALFRESHGFHPPCFQCVS